jgi:hypothetical protein
MASNVQLQSDAGVPVTSWNFGAIAGAADSQQKFRVENIGDQSATSVQISPVRLAQNDGVDFAQIAPDASGNPGAYSAAALVLGTMAPGDIIYFWVKATVPLGTTPAGNPRQFDIRLEYTGT